MRTWDSPALRLCRAIGFRPADRRSRPRDIGLVQGLEVSRLARNNAERHRLIELGGLTDTLIGDADGIYHPALFSDRLLLGLKGAMSEAELHVLRARLNDGFRSKAARGELTPRIAGRLCLGRDRWRSAFHPDEAVVAAIHNVFASFAQTGSARRVWLWFRSEGLTFPLQMHQKSAKIRWVEASYTAIHHVLTNPAYADAYAYGKSRRETMLDASGVHKRVRKLTSLRVAGAYSGPSSGASSGGGHMRPTRIASPRIPAPDRTKWAGVAVRKGRSAARPCHLRALRTPLAQHYRGRPSSPRIIAPAKSGRRPRRLYCLNVGGIQIDEAVAQAFIAALEPAKLAATVAAAEPLEADRETSLRQWQPRRRASKLRSQPRRAP